jgi:hypothetical protein
VRVVPAVIEYLSAFAGAMWDLRWLWLCVIVALGGVAVFADDGR